MLVPVGMNGRVPGNGGTLRTDGEASELSGAVAAGDEEAAGGN